MLEKHGLLLVRLNADAEAAAQYDEKAASAASMTTSEAPRDSDVDVDLLVREAEGVLAAETERVSAEREASEEEEDDDEEKAPIVAAQSSALRRAAVEALTGALTRSLDRSAEAAGLLREELAALRELLSCETKAEEARLGDIEALIVQLGMVIDGKAEIVVRETALLTNIQELKAQTVERVIRDSFDEAAAAKAELISIEMVLSETMVTVKAQLEIERDLAVGFRVLNALARRLGAHPDPVPWCCSPASASSADATTAGASQVVMRDASVISDHRPEIIALLDDDAGGREDDWEARHSGLGTRHSWLGLRESRLGLGCRESHGESRREGNKHGHGSGVSERNRRQHRGPQQVGSVRW